MTGKQAAFPVSVKKNHHLRLVIIKIFIRYSTKKAKMNGKHCYTLSYYTISGTKLATENDKKL